MTTEEKQKIKDCRILIVGYGILSELISDELKYIGFCRIRQSDDLLNTADFDIAIVVNTGQATASIPILYPFDFIKGGAVIAVLPGDIMNVPENTDARVWAAKYMIGYSAFWNTGNCEWLREALQDIRNGSTSEKAQRTAAIICARISANIAVGRDVKHFPRFYLSRNLE